MSGDRWESFKTHLETRYRVALAKRVTVESLKKDDPEEEKGKNAQEDD